MWFWLWFLMLNLVVCKVTASFKRLNSKFPYKEDGTWCTHHDIIQWR
jgi:hypothetical protein